MVKMKKPRSVVLALACSVALRVYAAEIDVAAGDLTAALESLAKQSGAELIYQPDQLKGYRTQGVKGNLSPQEAVTKLLEGTPLKLRTDSGGAMLIALPRATGNPASEQKPSRERASTETQGRSAASKEAADDELKETVELLEVLVTGSRIRRDPLEASANPVTVFTRVDIERSGAANMVDFIGRITQGNSNVTDRVVTDEPVSGRSTVNLRNLGNNTTLVLINGRRMTRTGRGFGVDDYDFNTIPITAVERIEVLTNSASAIYGADAIGGVINIITRQDYTGAEVSAQYGNTFDSDVSEKNVNFLFGQQGSVLNAEHAYSVMFNAAAYEQNALAAVDRPYSALVDYSASGGRSLEPVDPTSLIAGAGGVFVLPRGPFPATLPGLDVSEAAIPAGQDGRSLTLADFDSSTPVYSAQAEIPLYALLLAPISQRTASFSATLELTEGHEFFIDGAYSRHRTQSQGLPPSTSRPIPVPASNPFNPFGVDVFVNKVFYELGPSRVEFDNSTSRVATGLRGGLFGRNDWRYELSGAYDRNVGEVKRPVPTSIAFEPFSYAPPGSDDFEEITPRGYALLNETDPARALNLFGDGRTTQPNDIELLRSLLGVDESKETGETLGGTFTTDGAVAQLPGGPLRLAIGGEYREDNLKLYQRSDIARLYAGLTGLKQQDVQAKQQYAAAGFAEVLVPIVGEHQGVPGAKSLQVSLAGRFDKVSAVADSEEVTPKVGLLWTPFTTLSVRASYSRGFKPPSLVRMFAPETESFAFLDSLIDPFTGEPLGFVEIRQGGNPDLNSERSSSWSAGLVYEPHWLRDCSLSIDYFDIDYLDKVIGPSVRADIILEFFPERVGRDRITNAVTSLDVRPINLDSTRARGFDVKAVYQMQTAGYGAFDAVLNYTYNITNTEQGPPGTPRFERVDDTVPRAKANATVFWTFRGYDLGPTVAYESSSSNARNLFGGAVAPTRMRRAVVVDFQGSVDFDAAFPAAAGDWLKGLKLTAGINNVLDREPSPTNGEGGWAKIDPRQRRYYISLRKAF